MDTKKTDGEPSSQAAGSETREARMARIQYAESLGYKRCSPWLRIGSKTPRWFFQGGYYDFCELPNDAAVARKSPQAGGSVFACPNCHRPCDTWFDRTLDADGNMATRCEHCGHDVDKPANKEVSRE